ncbi:hypothetical protein HK102_002854 [Quaeritorhiza haematococci]|nr:hypothetical protein HK102_002854 [Quaeritorhiza haematococci]
MAGQIRALTCILLITIANHLQAITVTRAATINQMLYSVNPNKNPHDELLRYSRAWDLSTDSVLSAREVSFMDYAVTGFSLPVTTTQPVLAVARRTTSSRSNLLDKRQIETVFGVIAVAVVYIASMTAYLFTAPQPQLPAPPMVVNNVSPDRIRTAADCSASDRTIIIDTVNRASILLGRMLKDLDATVAIANANRETSIRSSSNLAKAFGVLRVDQLENPRDCIRNMKNHADNLEAVNTFGINTCQFVGGALSAAWGQADPSKKPVAVFNLGRGFFNCGSTCEAEARTDLTKSMKSTFWIHEMSHVIQGCDTTDFWTVNGTRTRIYYQSPGWTTIPAASKWTVADTYRVYAQAVEVNGEFKG